MYKDTSSIAIFYVPQIQVHYRSYLLPVCMRLFKGFQQPVVDTPCHRAVQRVGLNILGRQAVVELLLDVFRNSACILCRNVSITRFWFVHPQDGPDSTIDATRLGDA
jgi:hypothetical protein